jgi:hypothetical protein
MELAERLERLSTTGEIRSKLPKKHAEWGTRAGGEIVQRVFEPRGRL